MRPTVRFGLAALLASVALPSSPATAQDAPSGAVRMTDAYGHGLSAVRRVHRREEPLDGDHVRYSYQQVADSRSFECSAAFRSPGFESSDQVEETPLSVGDALQEYVELLELGTCPDARAAQHASMGPLASPPESVARHYARLQRALGPLVSACDLIDAHERQRAAPESIPPPPPLPPAPGADAMTALRATALASARQLLASTPLALRHLQCVARFEYVVDVPAAQLVDLDMDGEPVIDSRRGSTQVIYVVVRNVDPRQFVTVEERSLERMRRTEAALRVAAAVFGRGQPDAEHGADVALEAAPTGFGSRVIVHEAMDPGDTFVVSTSGDGDTSETEVSSLTSLGMVLGVGVGAEFIPSIGDDVPYGHLVADGSLRWDADRYLGAASIRALIGLRIDDAMVGLSLLLTSTTGSALQGVALHVGGRCRRISSAVYYDGFVGFRWGERPAITSMSTADHADLLAHATNFALTIGVQVTADLVALLSGAGTAVGALLGN